MELITSVNLVFAILILIIVLGTFYFTFLKSLAQQCSSKWDILNDLLHLRADKIPFLINLIAKFGIQLDENQLENLLKFKSRSWEINSSGKEKNDIEKQGSNDLNSFLEKIKNSQEIKGNYRLIALIEEFKKLEEDIKITTLDYNKKTNRFNSFSKLWIFGKLIPLLSFKAFFQLEI